MASKTITVSVNDSTNPVTVTCNPDELDIGKSTAAVTVFWEMATDATSAKYKITDVDGLPDEEFVQQGSNGKGWKATDNNDNTETYSYTVEVEEEESGDRTRQDPTIKNGGRE